MSDLERQIDELYQRSLTEFTSARNALAKALAAAGAKADAARVKALAKPTVIPWAVNQVYWRARSIWDRLVASGQALRGSQVAALSGQPSGPAKPSGVRRAGEDLEAAHRRAVADAVHQAVRAAADAAVQPAVDQLTRMLEAISLAASPAERPGRFTELVQPAGFEALLGVTIALPGPRAAGSTRVPEPAARRITTRARGTSTAGDARTQPDPVDMARRAAAAAALTDARRKEQSTRQAETAALEAVHDAELRLKQAKAALADAQAATRAAVAARERAEQTARPT